MQPLQLSGGLGGEAVGVADHDDAFLRGQGVNERQVPVASTHRANDVAVVAAPYTSWPVAEPWCPVWSLTVNRCVIAGLVAVPIGRAHRDVVLGGLDGSALTECHMSCPPCCRDFPGPCEPPRARIDETQRTGLLRDD